MHIPAVSRDQPRKTPQREFDLGFLDMVGLGIAMRRRQVANPCRKLGQPVGQHPACPLPIASHTQGQIPRDKAGHHPRRGCPALSRFVPVPDIQRIVPLCPGMSGLRTHVNVPQCPGMSAPAAHDAGQTLKPLFPTFFLSTSFSLARLKRLRAALSSSSTLRVLR